MKLDYRQRLLGTTLLVGASMLATPALAQDAQPTDVTTPTGPVEAQPTPSVSAEGEQVEQGQDIIVTGTRIPQPNLESAAPVTVVSNQDIKLQGATRIEDVLNSLPSVSAEQSSGQSNGATGTATVDLRGLGSKRTMVLVNGRRLMPGSPSTPSAADLNVIPASIVKRVEVLTGGASSTYGADAVSGVVNFIMDTNFTGIRFDGNYSFYQHSNRNKILPPLLDARANAGFVGFTYPRSSVVDGQSFDGTISIGTKFDDDRGHAVAYFGYRKVQPVTQDRRDYSACVLQVNDNLGDADGDGQGFDRVRPLQCGGSLTNRFGTGIFYVPTSDGAGGTTPTSTVGLLGPGVLQQGVVDRYNFAPTNYFQRPDERYTAGVFANYEINDQIKPYLEFMFMDDQNLAQIAPSGNFGNTLSINCDNPLLSAQQLATICTNNGGYNLVSGFLGTFPLVVGQTGTPALNFIDPTTGASYQRAFFQLLRRNVEGGPRVADLQHTSFRGVLGTKGDLNKAWSYDAYFQFGRTNYQQTYRNEFSVARLTRALDVVDDPRVAGVQPICRSVLDGTDPNCVPYDVFSGAPISAAAINYLSAVGFQRGQTNQQVGNVNFTGLLGEYGVKTPWAEDGLAVNIGAEYRKDSLKLDTDQAFRTGDLTGQGAPTLPVSGNYRVLEWFAEAQLPLVQNSFVEDLSLNAGYRKSYYKLSNGRKFDTDTYKLGLEFAPIKDVRLRGAYNRAVRAPNIQELFGPQIVGLNGAGDPCGGRALTAADIGCLVQFSQVNPGSVPADFIGRTIALNPAAQYNGFIGGNPNLEPEKATTKTLGVVLQPRFLPRFAFTVDYFNIKVKDAIQGFGQDAILAQCIAGTTSATNVDPSCALIRRNPANGSIWLTADGFVVDLPNNVGSVKTSGFEFNSSYSRRVGGLGTASFSFVGTWLRKFVTSNGLTAPYDCAGYFGPTCSGGGTTSSAPQPKWRHKARLSLNTPGGIGLSVQWRYIDKVTSEFASGNPTLTDGNSYAFNEVLKAQNYFDLAATATIGDNFNFRIGVNNIFDKEPPLVHSGSGNFGYSLCPTGPCNGNTFPGTYDSLGRYLYAGVTLDF